MEGGIVFGLTAALWADERQPDLAGAVLNSPWLDLHGSAVLRASGDLDLRGLQPPEPIV